MREFFAFLGESWPELLALTREHIFLVLLSTGLAVLVGVPLGVLLTRVKSLRTPVLGFANIMQTVPSLALFGLLIPIPFIGGIGARTAVIALALYALLPVIRNTVTGILGIDPKVREAAAAMGMTGGQTLRMVELPSGYAGYADRNSRRSCDLGRRRNRSRGRRGRRAWDLYLSGFAAKR